jgi:hypothetical protein
MADILFTTLRLLVLSFATSSAALDTGAVKNHDMQKTEVENEEFRRSYQFADGSHLEVSNVAVGSFLILPTDTDTAEVQITRSARDRADLACGALVVEHPPTRLVIRGSDKCGSPRRDTTLTQNVILRIPRRSNVSLSDIHGPVILGEIEGRGPNFIKGPDGGRIPQPVDRPNVVGRGFSGAVRMRKIRGPIRFVQGAGNSEITDISGPLVVAVRGLGDKGLEVRNVGSIVEIILSDKLNATLRVYDIKGRVRTGNPEGTARRTGDINFGEQFGLGGASITVTNVDGDVVIRRI